MAEYYNVTTNLGDAEIANAIATNTKLDITHIAFGDGNGAVPTPSKIRTTLLREVHRQAVTKYERHANNANWIVIETIIPSTVGGFTIREMGIIANGKLISHGSHAPFEKVADPTGVSEYRLKFTQNVRDGSVVEILLDESLIYASQEWVDENYIRRNEIVDNLTTNDSNKPVSAKQAKVLQDNKLDKNSNAVSATKLQTARNINGVAFDGSANINLPTASTSTSGTVQLNNSLTSTSTTQALTAAQGKNLQDEKLDKSGGTVTGGLSINGIIRGYSYIDLGIGAPDSNKGVTFYNSDGTARGSIRSTLNGAMDFTVATSFNFDKTINADISGNAATATKLATARNINGVAFDGSANINLPTASTSTSGTVQLNNSLTSTSTTQALTAAQGKNLQDEKLDKSGGTVTGGLSINGIIRGYSYIDLGIGAPDSNKGVTFYNSDGTARGSIRSTLNGAMDFTVATSFNFDKTINADISGNAATATKLATARTISLTGAATGSASFNGGGNISINVALTEFQGTKSINGYQRLPGGLILQWGSDDAQAAGATITYPISFPNGVFSVVVTDISTAGAANTLAVRTRSNNSFVVIGSNNDYFNWFAIGY